ncbi:hypothetical protein APASM_3003 [Actinosynnema pretiosum subsp. pretiosum]|nr:hypothetical protein APASM_3003 [Actinosynnema pretiosum subsp. pretiosum]
MRLEEQGAELAETRGDRGSGRLRRGGRRCACGGLGHVSPRVFARPGGADTAR